MYLEHADTNLGELGRVGFVLARDQRRAALQVDALMAYQARTVGMRKLHQSMVGKLGGKSIPPLAVFGESVGTLEGFAALARVLIDEARADIARNPYRGRAHRGVPSIESWALSVAIDLGEMRRLLPVLELRSNQADDASQDALVAVQAERKRRGENVNPWKRNPPTSRIDWNNASEGAMVTAIRSITPASFGFALGGTGVLLGLAALWFFTRTPRRILGRR